MKKTRIILIGIAFILILFGVPMYITYKWGTWKPSLYQNYCYEPPEWNTKCVVCIYELQDSSHLREYYSIKSKEKSENDHFGSLSNFINIPNFTKVEVLDFNQDSTLTRIRTKLYRGPKLDSLVVCYVLDEFLHSSLP